jgi:nucleoside phosphorylase
MAKGSGRRQAPAHVITQPVLCTILLVLALPEERDYLYDAMEERADWTIGLRLDRDRCWFQTEHGRVQVVVQVLAGMGPIEAVLGTSAGMSAVPDLVVMIGLAGSLDHDRCALGDVVISSRAKYYTTDKVGVPGSDGRKYRFEDEAGITPPRPANEVWIDPRDRFMSRSYLRYLRNFAECPAVDDIISEVQASLKGCALEELEPDWIPRAFKDLPSLKRERRLMTGWLLGSTHVVDSAEYRTYLLEKDKDQSKDIHAQTNNQNRNRWTDGRLLAVDMESYGMLRVVTQMMSANSPYGASKYLLGGLLVRGISDMCEEKSDLDANTKDKVRRLAVTNATRIGLTLIESLDHLSIQRGHG